MYPRVKTAKPTYDELEQRVRDLERIVLSGEPSGPSIAEGVSGIESLREADATLRKSDEKFRPAHYTGPAAINLNGAAEQYRAIFENAVEGFFQSTPEGRFIRVN